MHYEVLGKRIRPRRLESLGGLVLLLSPPTQNRLFVAPLAWSLSVSVRHGGIDKHLVRIERDSGREACLDMERFLLRLSSALRQAGAG